MNITTANHRVYIPYVFTKSIIESTAIREGPTILISPKGTIYPPITFSVVSKNSATLKLTLNNKTIISPIKINSNITEDVLVELPSVL